MKHRGRITYVAAIKLLTVICCLAMIGGAASAGAAAAAKNKLPVKVYLMAGQSNMEGHGQNGYIEKNSPELMKPVSNVWCVYEGKISGPLKPGFGAGEGTYGIELTMGRILCDTVSNPVVLIKSCVGGTGLHDHWRPPSAVKRAGGKVGPLYIRMMKSMRAFFENIHDILPFYEDQGVELAGFVWFQGENDGISSDEHNVGYSQYYEQNLKDLIADVRMNLGVPELPVLIVQINDTWGAGGEVVRAVQQRVAEQDGHATWIKTFGLSPDYHYDSPSHLTIGERAGKALVPFITKTVPQDLNRTLAANKKFFDAVAPAMPGHPDTSSLKKGLVGYWPFDEGTGVTTADKSGVAKGAVGELIGNPKWVKGLLGGAVMLTGEQCIKFEDFKDPLTEVKIGARTERRIANLSVSVWMRANRYGDGYVGKSAGADGYQKNGLTWFLCPRAINGGWALECHDDGGNAFFTAMFDHGCCGIYSGDEDKKVVGDGYEWHHIVVVHDGGKKTLDMYVDGKMVDKRQGVNVQALRGITEGTGIVPSRNPLQVGGHIDRERQFQVFDELAIWDRPVTADEVKSLYNNGYGAEIQ